MSLYSLSQVSNLRGALHTVLDAKRELPPNNVDTAKDIAAMATDGGVVIYGIAEDADRRLVGINPIPLTEADRISNIVQSSIAESPRIVLHRIQSAANPAVGYVVVHVPASERAPHMVAVRGEHRYYGRNAAGNYVLSEGEVARLYERRRRWEVDRSALLDAEIAQSPYPPTAGAGFLFAVIRPVSGADAILQDALRAGENVPTLLHQLVRHSRALEIFPLTDGGDFREPAGWLQRADGYYGQMWWQGNADQPHDPSDSVALQINFDGSGHLFNGRAAQTAGTGFWFVPLLVAGNTVRLLRMMGELYERANYAGLVDIGLAVTGIRGSKASIPDLNIRFHSRLVAYDQSDYRRTTRVPAIALLNETTNIARSLLMRLFEAMTQGAYDPFPARGPA
jgi:hypothetical protein